MKPKASKSKNSWGCISMMVLPFIALLAFMGWRISRLDEDQAEAQAKRSALASTVDEIQSMLYKISGPGATASVTPSGAVEIVLPSEIAVSISSSAAKELALTARSKTGSIVRIKSPAGQILAEAP